MRKREHEVVAVLGTAVQVVAFRKAIKIKFARKFFPFILRFPLPFVLAHYSPSSAVGLKILLYSCYVFCVSLVLFKVLDNIVNVNN